MLDIKHIRSDPQFVEKKLQDKDPAITLQPLLELDQNIRLIKAQIEQLQAKRKLLSKDIGQLRSRKEDFSTLQESVQKINQNISELEKNLREKTASFEQIFLNYPNIAMDDVPISLDPEVKECLHAFAEKKSFSFSPKNHLELNEKLHLFDLLRGAKLSGSGWVVYKGWGARLEWALLNYMLDIHKKNGFYQIMPPLLLKEEIMLGSAQLPKFADQLFQLNDEDFPLYLTPTAEASLNGLHFNEILEENMLPIKYVAYTPCFRRESGAAGKKERGLIRTHQFNKVELFSITTPENSEKVFKEMLSSAEEVLQGLEIHYQAMLLCTADTSFASAKTIDLEAWLPGQNAYYEVSSVSHCTDFQARRSKMRYKKETKNLFPHTLNASGVATSRLMVSFLETHQKEDGSIYIPPFLRPYFSSIDTLTKDTPYV